jgi:hypothetical protein
VFAGQVTVGRGTAKRALKVLTVSFDVQGATMKIHFYVCGDKAMGHGAIREL